MTKTSYLPAEGEYDESTTHIERRVTSRRRLSVDISADLHRRILVICATRRLPVNQAVREVLEKAFPG